ncbi:hypothetical protein K1719_007138 [Acacia pycnantha]|nr:hypothetical protein K1719_007138 [Acacia pycnantha]
MAKFSRYVPNFLREKISQRVKTPEVVGVDDFKLESLTDEGLELLVKFSVYNPNFFSIPLFKISYALKFANSREPGAEGTIPRQESLKGNKKTPVDVPVRVKYSIIKDVMKDYINDLDLHCHISLEITIDLPLIDHNFTIPYSFDKEIKLTPQILFEILRRIMNNLGIGGDKE